MEAKKNSKIYEPHEDYLDEEQYMIEKMLIPYAGRIIKSKDPVKELVDVNYQLIDENLLKMIAHLKEQFNGKIILVGGVMINTSPDHHGYFDLRRLEMRQNGTRQSLKL